MSKKKKEKKSHEKILELLKDEYKLVGESYIDFCLSDERLKELSEEEKKLISNNKDIGHITFRFPTTEEVYRITEQAIDTLLGENGINPYPIQFKNTILMYYILDILSSFNMKIISKVEDVITDDYNADSISMDIEKTSIITDFITYNVPKYDNVWKKMYDHILDIFNERLIQKKEIIERQQATKEKDDSLENILISAKEFMAKLNMLADQCITKIHNINNEELNNLINAISNFTKETENLKIPDLIKSNESEGE